MEIEKEVEFKEGIEAETELEKEEMEEDKDWETQIEKEFESEEEKEVETEGETEDKTEAVRVLLEVGVCEGVLVPVRFADLEAVPDIACVLLKEEETFAVAEPDMDAKAVLETE